MGMLPKCNVKDYWTVGEVISTPFPGTVMSRNDFMVILSFLHCADNAQYIPKGQSGYNPKKKKYGLQGCMYRSMQGAFPLRVIFI